MINATYTSLAVGPKILIRICVDFLTNIDFFGVLDNSMLVFHSRQSIVDSKFIGINLRPGLNIQSNHRHNGLLFDVLNCSNFKLPISLNHTDNRDFAFCTTSTFSASLSAKVTFVNLNFTTKQILIFFKALTDKFAHSPSCFVGNARFPFNLFSRNTPPGLCHEIDYIEPNCKWCAGLVKNGSGGWANLMPAKITSVCLATANSMKQSVFSTFRAFNTFWIFLIPNILKAYIIIGKFFEKLLECEFLHFLFFSHFVSAILDKMVLISIYSIVGLLLGVKGYSPNLFYKPI